MWRKIDVSVDTFALIWAARQAGESTEDEIIARLAKTVAGQAPSAAPIASDPSIKEEETEMPRSGEWVDVLVWALGQLGGKAHLSSIYAKTRDARRRLGLPITLHHDAAARERLESYCRESKNYKHIADLFYMPEGKGAGIWALRKKH